MGISKVESTIYDLPLHGITSIVLKPKQQLITFDKYNKIILSHFQIMSTHSAQKISRK